MRFKVGGRVNHTKASPQTSPEIMVDANMTVTSKLFTFVSTLSYLSLFNLNGKLKLAARRSLSRQFRHCAEVLLATYSIM